MTPRAGVSPADPWGAGVPESPAPVHPWSRKRAANTKPGTSRKGILRNREATIVPPAGLYRLHNKMQYPYPWRDLIGPESPECPVGNTFNNYLIYCMNFLFREAGKSRDPVWRDPRGYGKAFRTTISLSGADIAGEGQAGGTETFRPLDDLISAERCRFKQQGLRRQGGRAMR